MQAICKKTVTRFELADLDGLTWLPMEAGPLLEKLVSKSAIWTGRVDGQVVAICGITMMQEHAAKAWSYLHPDVRAHRYWLHRRVKRILRQVVAASEFWRVEADCYTTHAAAHIWLTRLGFQREGEMPLSGPKGEGMTRYAWFPRGLLG